MLKIYKCACTDKQYLKEAKYIDSLRKNGIPRTYLFTTDIPQFLKNYILILLTLKLRK